MDQIWPRDLRVAWNGMVYLLCVVPCRRDEVFLNLSAPNFDNANQNYGEIFPPVVDQKAANVQNAANQV